ncbi:MAG: cupin domain-containing protein, partial [Candidatus Binatia bacterium]
VALTLAPSAAGFYARAVELFRTLGGALQFSAEKMKKNPLFATERFFCDVYAFEPGQAQAGHRHDESDKVYYVLEGSGEFRVDSTERQLSAGGAVFCPAGSEHSVRNSGPGRLALLVFMAPPPGKAAS